MDQTALIQLAFSLYNNKGAYALLVGSGLSRAANIPTGWEITLEMIRQIAALHGEDCSSNPEKWYFEKYKKQPGYSDLLDHLGKTSTERNSFIKKFIESTEEERAEGKKQPTEAHRAIARLVSSGIIKVIITTNFDRLLEKAIEDEGIVPNVIASADGAIGATPLIHSNCTIIKLNGDYLDIRSKNTVLELTEYDESITNLLERIFDEFGLIICGWSADWDTGLYALIEKIKGRRYSCFWSVKNNLSEKASKLANLRAAIKIQIEDANSFFSSVEEKISAIAELRRPHPLSPELAVVSLKKYITEEKYKVKLYDLVMDEVKRVGTSTSEERFPMSVTPFTNDIFENRVANYISELDTLLPLVINGCWWGNASHDGLWIKTIERIANGVADGAGFTNLRELRLLPASILMYGSCIAAISTNRFNLMNKILHEPQIAMRNRFETPINCLFPFDVAKPDYFPLTPEGRKRRTPLNDIFHDALKNHFSDLLPSNKEFEHAFDRFEYLLALAYCQVSLKERSKNNMEYVWVPPGRFLWKDQYHDHISKIIDSEIEKSKNDWQPIKQGLLRGDHKSVLEKKVLVDNFSHALGWNW